MNICVKNVCDILRKEKIPFDLRADESTNLSKPVDWISFNGENMAFYSGAEIDVLKKWKDPNAGLIICSESLKENCGEGPFLFVKNPRVAFVLSLGLFIEKQPVGIHPSAIIASEAQIGENVSIGPLSVIGAAKIGDNSTIGSLVSITDDVEIGRNVRIMNGSHIGEPGTSCVLDVEGKQRWFPHYEKVLLEDNVLVGAGVIILQGVLTPTIIGRGTHIAMGCKIGHNCKIGENVYLAPGATLGGSVKVGPRCFLGMECCIKDGGITIAEDITIGMNATIIRSCVDPGVTLMSPPSKSIGNMFSSSRKPY